MNEIFTIGHSTRLLEEFIELLQDSGVTEVADVRTIPRSRYNPQFNKETFPEDLKKAGIKYEHMSGLGGLRHPRKDSPNTGWKNDSFRGFADYMQTGEFEESLENLIQLSGRERIAVMCAEAVPWRCHRRLIADALLARGIKAVHIMGKHSLQNHAMTPWAKIEGKKIIYI
ncbi:MAG: DUF488 domain-containing protein [Firmicutes bacterium]|nr:DUF488 domain-containing protein [Bacillota bacterium]